MRPLNLSKYANMINNTKKLKYFNFFFNFSFGWLVMFILVLVFLALVVFTMIVFAVVGVIVVNITIIIIIRSCRKVGIWEYYSQLNLLFLPSSPSSAIIIIIIIILIIIINIIIIWHEVCIPHCSQYRGWVKQMKIPEKNHNPKIPSEWFCEWKKIY